MDKDEIRAVIKFKFVQGLTPVQIIAEFKKVLGESAPSDRTVYKWFNEFKRGRTSTEDEQRSGRPNDVVTPEIVRKIHEIVLADNRLKIDEIVEKVGISHGSVSNVLHEHLHMKKVSERWIPCAADAENTNNL